MNHRRFATLCIGIVLPFILSGVASAASGKSEVKGAAILDHPCGKVAVKQMGLTHAGKMDEAEKRYRDVADSAPAAYAALAKMSLSQVYAAEGKAADGEKVLRDLMAHPTLTVSKEAAALALGRLLAKTNPTEARKLLEPLRNERASISQAAVTALGELPPQALNK